MRRASLLTAIPALLVIAVASAYGCNSMDLADTDDRSPQSARVEPATQKALAVVSTVHAHQMVERAGERVVFHPGWSSRIEVVGAGGERSEIYRQTRPYKGAHPSEVVLGFRDVALALFDPSHRIRGITVETLDGQAWSFDDLAAICPPSCPSDGTAPTTTPTPAPIDPCPPSCPSEGTDPPATSSLVLTTAPLSPARLALAPAERARASVSTGPEHRVAEAAGERVTYHPGWSSRIQRVDAMGRSQEIYRLARPFEGAHPSEVVLGFRDVALALFDPNHRISRITVKTLDGAAFSIDDRTWLPPPPPPPPPVSATEWVGTRNRPTAP